MENTLLIKHLLKHPSVMIFLGLLAGFTLLVVGLAEGAGIGLISTSFVKTLGKTLCLCMIAIAMDLVWGFCGILSLGHFAFFALGGYMIGMWLMFARTKLIVLEAAQNAVLPMTQSEISQAVGTQIFGVVGGAEIPAMGLTRSLRQHAHGHPRARQLLLVAVQCHLLPHNQLNAPVERMGRHCRITALRQQTGWLNHPALQTWCGLGITAQVQARNR